MNTHKMPDTTRFLRTPFGKCVILLNIAGLATACAKLVGARVETTACGSARLPGEVYCSFDSSPGEVGQYVMQDPVAEREALMDRFLPVKDGFRSAAKVFDVRYPDALYGRGRFLYLRRVVSIALPKGTTPDRTRAEMTAEARKAFESGAMSVRVYAYEEGGGFREQGTPLGRILFAPFGDWDRTERQYDLDKYEVEVSTGETEPETEIDAALDPPWKFASKK